MLLVPMLRFWRALAAIYLYAVQENQAAPGDEKGMNKQGNIVIQDLLQRIKTALKAQCGSKKAAGSTFEGLLCHYLANNDMITAVNLEEARNYINATLKEKDIKRLNDSMPPFDQNIKDQFSQDISLAVAHSALPETKSYFSFRIIRNPFNRHLSSYRWKRGHAM